MPVPLFSPAVKLAARIGLVIACLGFIGAEKLPSRYDESKNSFIPSGEAAYEYRLLGVAIKWDKACRSGNAKECLHLAQAFSDGLGDLKADDRVALGYYQLACDRGSAEGCAAAAAMIYNWDGPAKNVRDLGKAQAYAEKGCNQKNQESCATLGVILAETDPARATALMEDACTAGEMEGCRVRANALFYEQADPASRTAAIPLLEKGCAAKQAWGCSGLADAYENGWGVARDGQKAIAYARTGCIEGDGTPGRVYACRLHGMYLTYQADKASFNMGEKYLNTSCLAGDGNACAYIGKIGLRHRNSDQTTTLVEGLYYLRRACDLNVASGCRELANAYNEGVGVDGDVFIAYALYNHACAMKMKSACQDADDIHKKYSRIEDNLPPIDPALPAMQQIGLAIQQVETGQDMEPAVMTVYRLTREGNEEAEWILGGWMYYGLPGVFDPPRQKDGLILFDNAARVGHVKAAIWMGMAYWYGDGVEEDREKGQNYMAIAASRGDEMAAAIYESMLNEPVRQAMAEHARQMEESMIDRRSVWEKAFDAWDAAIASGAYSGSSYSPPNYSSSSSGRSVSDIIDQCNWNQMYNYYSGATTACPSSNPYC